MNDPDRLPCIRVL